MPGIHGDQEKALDLWNWRKKKMFVRHHVGTRNGT